MIEIGDKDFKAQVLDASVPAVVFFYADWAGPCNLLRPEIEAVEQAFGNSVVFSTLNIEDHPHTPIAYQVKGVPALLLFHGGERIASKVCAISSEQISAWLAEKGAV